MPPKVDPKRSIGQYDGKCKILIGKATAFKDANPIGLTEAGRKKANDLREDLRNQFKRMETKWEENLKPDLEATDQNASDALDKRVADAGEAVDQAIDILDELLDMPTLGSASSASPSTVQ